MLESSKIFNGYDFGSTHGRGCVQVRFGLDMVGPIAPLYP